MSVLAQSGWPIIAWWKVTNGRNSIVARSRLDLAQALARLEVRLADEGAAGIDRAEHRQHRRNVEQRQRRPDALGRGNAPAVARQVSSLAAPSLRGSSRQPLAMAEVPEV